MRVFYLDAGLGSNTGHHANFCRLITGELKRRQVPTFIFGRADCTLEIQTELAAQPLFRWNTYLAVHQQNDPISGWLRDFEQCAQTTLEDLQRLGDVRPTDVVLFNAIFPPQLMAAVRWLHQFSPSARPKIVVEFGAEPGLAAVTSLTGRRHFEVPDPRRDGRATLYHFAASAILPADRAHLKLVTYDPLVSSVYQGLLGGEVGTLPWPIDATPPVRPRRGKRPITLSFLGHQRADKGYPLAPEIVRELISEPGVQFLIHNSAPQHLVGPQEALHELSRSHPNLTLDNQAISAAGWAKLLDATDLMICPYDPVRYATSHSGIMAECLANGIPSVIPAGTSLANLARTFGGPSVEFAKWDAASVVAAVREAIGQFDVLADRPAAAASQWRTAQGAARTIDALLG